MSKESRNFIIDPPRQSIVTAPVVTGVIERMKDLITQKVIASERKFLHTVVLAPANKGRDDEWNVLFNGPVVGEWADYPKPYDVNAMKKALLSGRTKMDTIDVVRGFPTMLQEGDIIFAGGVYRYHLGIGVSGGPEELDHEIADDVAKGIDDYYTNLIAKMRENGLAGKGPATIPVTTIPS